MTESEQTIRAMLTGGDRRSMGNSDQVAELITRDAAGAAGRVAELVECLFDGDRVLAVRAVDTLERVSRTRPALLEPYKARLMGMLETARQVELRWHLALVVPRLRLDAVESRQTAKLLQAYLNDRSSVGKPYAMQGLTELALRDAKLRPLATELVGSLVCTGTSSMRARGTRLLALLANSNAVHCQGLPLASV